MVSGGQRLKWVSLGLTQGGGGAALVPEALRENLVLLPFFFLPFCFILEHS